jgi:hypothetical protein
LNDEKPGSYKFTSPANPLNHENRGQRWMGQAQKNGKRKIMMLNDEKPGSYNSHLLQIP